MENRTGNGLIGMRMERSGHEGTFKDGEMIKETYWDVDGNKK
jgi:hypothetical protein